MTKNLSRWRIAITWKILASSLTAVFVLATAGSANAQERKYPYHELISGSAAPSSFDYDGDGVKGHYVTFAGRSNWGPVHGAYLVEYNFQALAPDSACPAGTFRAPIVVSASSHALTGTEGQIFMKDDAPSGLFCLDLNTLAFTMSLKGEFVGGMGKFAGATGAYEYKGSGQVLLLDSNQMPFGGFVLETKGTISLPNLHHNH